MLWHLDRKAVTNYKRQPGISICQHVAQSSFGMALTILDLEHLMDYLLLLKFSILLRNSIALLTLMDSLKCIILQIHAASSVYS